MRGVMLRFNLRRMRLWEALPRLVSPALDLLFPLNCAVCNREGRVLCQGCEAALPRLEMPYCSICASPGVAGLCDWCASTRPAIDGIRAPYLMDGAVRDLVYGLKYRNLRAAAPDMGRLLSGYLQSNRVPADVLVPVPLHGRRERERGYNQSALLARQLSKISGTPVAAKALHRTRNTPPQVSIAGHEERRHNIEGAFECRSPLGGRRVLLIDDVVTTGSTMSACAAALKTAGVSSVWGLAVARQA